MIILQLIAASVLVQQASVPVRITVNWPNSDVIKSKYPGKLPKTIAFGEVVGCNEGDSSIFFGEGEVIQALRLNGYQALSIRDAVALVSKASNGTPVSRVITYGGVIIKSIVEAKATGAIDFNSNIGVGLVTGAVLADIILRNLQGALTVQQWITYSVDGLQPLMQIPARRCSPPGSVLFGSSNALRQDKSVDFVVQVYPSK